MSYDINQTFIIEAVSDTGSTMSACTGLYTNSVSSCSGNTQIILGNGTITFDGIIYTNDDLSANSISASTFYSGGTNVFDIIDGFDITGGTYNSNIDSLLLYKNNGGSITITGFTDYYTTGATLIGNTVYFDRNDTLSAYTLDLSSFSSDKFVTGVTFTNNQIIIGRNDGVNLNTFINNFTGLTVNGLLNSNSISAATISATTFYGDGSNLTGISTQDTFVTGGTYSNGIAIFTNNTGGTFNVSGFYTGATDVFVTGGTYSAGTATFTNNTGGTFTVSGFNEEDLYITGGTFNKNNETLSLTNNSGITITITGFTDVFVTGGTYSAGTATFTNNSGTTFSVSGFYTGATDVFVTGGTYSNGTATFTNNTGGTFTVLGFTNPFTGGTVTGATIFTNGLTANTISATTYQNLPFTADTFTTAFTYSNNVFTISRNQGQSSLTATINTMTGLTVNGSTALNGSITSNVLTGTTDRMVQVNSGGTISATQEIISAYISSGSTAANLLENTSNWDINGNYTGTTITGTYQGQRYYDGNYFYEAVLDNIFIRLIRG
jgi:hypothetical protein